MASTFHCSIVTPSAAAFEGDVTYATFQAWDGQQGVLGLRSPLLTKLGVGSVRLDVADGTTRRFLLCGGFAQMHEDSLTLLTERAIPAEDISTAEAEAELKKANAEVVTGTEDRQKLERQQQIAMAKVALVRTAGAG
ncbi:MAG: ATP synthase F1 subunit epsilon [Phycisphaerales bacterium]|nr:MAG: ATP synthase F1 subunit epsilon [Phycisphaerales bacterium]